jgi:hypothetical protein
LLDKMKVRVRVFQFLKLLLSLGTNDSHL